MTYDPNLRGKDMDASSEARLWNFLDLINARLTNIEGKLNEVVRLEEKVNNHNETIKRYGIRLDNHDERIRKVENNQSENKGKSGSKDKIEAWVVAGVSSIVTAVIVAIVIKRFIQ